MPIYEYECRDCKLVFEVIRSFGSADLPLECESCKSDKIERMVSNFYSMSSGPISSTGHSSCGSCSGGNCSSCH